MNQDTIDRLKDYSKKLHDRRLIPDPNMMTGFEVTTYNRSMLPSRAQLNYGLGHSLNLFDTTDPKSDDYHKVVDYFNRCISLCVANNVFKDNETAERLQDCQTEYSKLKKELEVNKSIIETLRTDRDSYKAKFELYDQHFKGMYGSGQTQSGSVDEQSS